MTGEPNSFAYRTMTTRIPAIAQSVLAGHAGRYPPPIIHALQDLHDEIVHDRPVHPLETTTSDREFWAAAWQPYRDKSWLNIPWYFAEAFFYRRLLEAAGYFGGQGEEADSWTGVDPFLPDKQAELQSQAPWRVLDMALHHAPDNSADSFRALLHHCLWGNRVDLSYTKISQTAGRQITLEREQANLLVDDTEALLTHLGRPGNTLTIPSPATRSHVDFICDNAGTELLLDLALADFLLRFDWAGQVILHLKAHPTFVSDATPTDVGMTIAAIKTQPAAKLQALAGRLENYLKQDRLHLQPDLFWNSSLFFWEIPSPLRAELAQAQLVIVKGDANYRRLLGDSRWPTTTPAADAIPYFPAPLVALRTMKSDPVVGLKPGQAKALDKQDAEWRVNGKRGIIQTVI